MRISTVVLGAVSAFAIAGGANAAVVVGSIYGAPDPGPRAGETYVIDFDAGLPTGVTLTGDGAIVSGDLAGQYAAPAGDATPYLTVPSATSNGTATLTFADFLGSQNVTGFSFYWGSIDAYNSLELLDRSGNVLRTIGGADIPPANGDQALPVTNRRVTFDLTGADQALGGLRFTSTQYAFESDTFSFSTGAVPEPATWAMMILGFGGAGVALRRRRAVFA